MPTYEYACTSCGHHLEVFQSFSEEPLTTCPNCGGDLRKVFGSIGIVLKGSGFYRTDSRSASNGKSVSKEHKDKDKEKKDKEKKETVSSGSGESAASTSGGSTSASPSPAGSNTQKAAASAG